MSTCKFEQFNELYGIKPTKSDAEYILNSANLIVDEVKELLQEAYGNVDIQVNVSEPKKDIDKSAVTGEFVDIAYITGQRATEGGIRWDEALSEKHRSNMSKSLPEDMSRTEIAKEVTEALKRYPNAMLYPVGSSFVIKCASTGKLIKPMCYSQAVMVQGVHYFYAEDMVYAI